MRKKNESTEGEQGSAVEPNDESNKKATAQSPFRRFATAVFAVLMIYVGFKATAEGIRQLPGGGGGPSAEQLEGTAIGRAEILNLATVTMIQAFGGIERADEHSRDTRTRAANFL